MNRRAASGKLQDRLDKNCSGRLLSLNAQTYQRYLAKEEQKQRKKEEMTKKNSDWILKPAY
jgi:hypothetical protein